MSFMAYKLYLKVTKKGGGSQLNTGDKYNNF